MVNGALALTNSTISGNRAREGGGVFSNRGSAIAASSPSTTARLRVITGGYSTGGGELFNSGNITVTNSTISNNSAGFGGGVYTEGDKATLTNSTLLGNSAYRSGSGVFNNSNVTLTNSTISGNTADADGAGVFNNGFTTLTLTNSTTSDNSAYECGGAVFSVYGYDSTLNRTRTLVSGNTASNGAEIVASDATVNAANFNLFGHSGLTNARAFAGLTPGTTDITATSNGNTPTRLSPILNHYAGMIHRTPKVAL